MSEKREWTAERHAAAWDRCNRATSGPWKWWTSNSHRRLTAEDRQDGGVAYGTKQRDGCGDIVVSEADMAFIEESRVDLPDALREIENLRTALENERSSPVWAILGKVQAALGLPRGALLGEVVAAAVSLQAERDDARAEIAKAQGILVEIGAPEHMIGRHDEDPRATLVEQIGALRHVFWSIATDRGKTKIPNGVPWADAAEEETQRLRAELAKLGALKSAEIAPVIERFREAFGADVPRAPIGKRAEAERDAWERLRSAATAAVEAYENSDADETFEPVFESLDDALAGLATFEEESGDGGEPAKVDTPVRHARHDRHCMIGDGGGCSHEPGCEVEE